MGKIIAVCTGREKGGIKRRVGQAGLASNFGLSGDCDAGKGEIRQVKLCAFEDCSLAKVNPAAAVYGSRGEHLLIEGLDFSSLKEGDTLRTGDIVLKVSALFSSEERIYGNGCYCRVVFGGIVTEGDFILKE